MAITLVEPPSPYFLPLLIFIVLFEVALLLGKRQKCKSLTLEIKSLTLRKFELALAMKSVSICSQNEVLSLPESRTTERTMPRLHRVLGSLLIGK